MTTSIDTTDKRPSVGDYITCLILFTGAAGLFVSGDSFARLLGSPGWDNWKLSPFLPLIVIPLIALHVGLIRFGLMCIRCDGGLWGKLGGLVFSASILLFAGGVAQLWGWESIRPDDYVDHLGIDQQACERIAAEFLIPWKLSLGMILIVSLLLAITIVIRKRNAIVVPVSLLQRFALVGFMASSVVLAGIWISLLLSCQKYQLVFSSERGNFDAQRSSERLRANGFSPSAVDAMMEFKSYRLHASATERKSCQDAMKSITYGLFACGLFLGLYSLPTLFLDPTLEADLDDRYE